tara:strand:+ start:379 stop:819 length:441 start_codon:yes stop_codon:yes gene_type:complete
MAISASTVTTSFKTQVLTATHDFTASSGDTFKLAMYTNSSALSASTATYADGTATNEITGTGYSGGGNSLTSSTPVASGTTAVCDFADTSWTSATITAYGALIYNSSKANKSVCVLNFGGDKTATNGTFTIQFPVPDASNAILRLA